MRPILFMLLAGAMTLAEVDPANAQGPFDSSVKPFLTKRDARPDPRKVPAFVDDQPVKSNGLYMRDAGIGVYVIHWLRRLKGDWTELRAERQDFDACLDDLRKTIPEEGAVLMKVLDATPREALLKFNSKHSAVPHDALYAFSQARGRIRDAELEITKAEADVASATASVESATAGQTIFVSSNELATLKARREQIHKDAQKGWAKDLLKAGRTIAGAIKNPAEAMKTIGLDFLAEGFDLLLTEMALSQHREELASIAIKEERLEKLIADEKLNQIKQTLEAAVQKLRGARVRLVQAEMRRLVSLADARHQLMRLSLLEEGDGQGSPKLFRALAKYHTTSDVMAGFVETSGKEYLFRLMSGPSAATSPTYEWLVKEINDVKTWSGDYSAWLNRAEDTRHYMALHYEWYNRQHGEVLRILAATSGRAHWNLTEAVVKHTLLVMEQGGKS